MLQLYNYTKLNNVPVSQAKDNHFFQRKPASPAGRLTINQPNDPDNYRDEQEADAMADHVMRMADNKTAQQSFFKPVSTIYRKCAACEKEEKEKLQRKERNSETVKSFDTNNYINSLSGGSSLNVEERSFFEPRMGYDFSNVRLHTDDAADKSAQSINALAYTTGNNIVFRSNQYKPDSEEGRRLLAHELTHVVQQSSNSSGIQRKEWPGSTDDIHGPLTEQFAGEENLPAEPGVQYSADYAIWLAVKSGNNIKFTGTDIARQNPLDRMSIGLSTGFTDLIINNKRIPSGNLALQTTELTKQLTPANFVFKDLSNGMWSSRIAADFKILSKAEITIPTAPANNGWSANVASNVFTPLNPPACAAAGSIPVRLRGKPTDQILTSTVDISERQHVNELQILYQRHLVPYYHFAMDLKGIGNSEADATADLLNKLKNRLDETVFGFALADAAEARKFDRPGGIHQGKFNVTNWNQCNPVEMEFTTGNVQQPQLKPGNIQMLAPVSINFNAANLQIQGNDVKNGGQVVKAFSNPQNAQLALNVLKAYNATSINRIGSFEYILVGGKAPTGAQPNVNELELKPDFYQVTIGVRDPDDWVISQMDGGNFQEIVNFGQAGINQAYSAIEMMRRFHFTHKCMIGADMVYFRID